MGSKISIRTDFCKACGICTVLCPKQILKIGEEGRVYVTDENECIACRQCEYHCPDFAITVGEYHG